MKKFLFLLFASPLLFAGINGGGGGGGSGVTTVGTIDSQTASSDGAVISSSDIVMQSASTSNPGVVNNSAQSFSGAKKVVLDSNNQVTIDPNAQSMVKIQGNNNSNNVLYEAASASADTNEYSGYIMSTSAGSHVAGISVSGPSATGGGAGYPVNLMRYTSSVINGMRFFTADQTANTKFDWWTNISGTSASRMSLTNDGVFNLRSRGSANVFTADPGNSGGNFLTMSGGAGAASINLTNTNPSGYSTVFAFNDLGNFAALQASGSTAPFSIALADQVQLFGGGAGGTLIWAQGGPVSFGTGAGGSAGVRVVVNTDGSLKEKKGFIRSYQRVAQTNTGSVTINDNTSTLVLTGTSTVASYTITLPAAPIDGQEVNIVAGGTVTALTLSANTGQTLLGGVTTIGPGLGQHLIYQSTDTSWYH